jgi:hypothetical protein
MQELARGRHRLLSAAPCVFLPSPVSRKKAWPRLTECVVHRRAEGKRGQGADGAAQVVPVGCSADVQLALGMGRRVYSCSKEALARGHAVHKLEDALRENGV